MKQNGRPMNAGEDKAEAKLASKQDKKNTSPVPPPPFRAATKVTVQQNEIPDPPPEKD